jgi:uncharacterized OB-fold protein
MSDAISKFAKGADAPYWAALEKGELHMPRCQGCKQWHWPAVSRCSTCGSERIDWPQVEFSGIVYAWTRTWTQFQGTEGLPTPYVTLLVELPQAGDRRLLGVLEDDETGLAIGAKVTGHAGITHCNGEDIPALRWRLASAAQS